MTAISRMRITLDVPREWVRSSNYVIEQTDLGPYIWSTSTEMTSFTLTQDLVPELLGLNADDPQEVLAFVKKFGPLNAPTGAAEGGWTVWHTESLEEFKSRFYGEGSGFQFGEYLLDFQVGVSELRYAQALADELSWPDPNIRVVRAAAADRIIGSAPGSITEARMHLKLILDAGLSAFSLHFQGAPGRGGPSFRAETGWSLFSIACLEISVAALGGLPWRACALDTCFAVFQPSRRDQLFHDKRCARAQASRDWRRRQTQGKGR